MEFLSNALFNMQTAVNCAMNSDLNVLPDATQQSFRVSWLDKSL